MQAALFPSLTGNVRGKTRRDNDDNDDDDDDNDNE